MKGVKKVDFSAVASLVGFLKILNSRGKDSRIAFINISPRFKALLNISKTAALFKIYRSEEEAIAGMIKV
jgi:anti-anti-sigma regulatory factor